ncbi:MAG: hypothetical protein RSB61_05335, partial [Clostridia bacterium]
SCKRYNKKQTTKEKVASVTTKSKQQKKKLQAFNQKQKKTRKILRTRTSLLISLQKCSMIIT